MQMMMPSYLSTMTIYSDSWARRRYNQITVDHHVKIGPWFFSIDGLCRLGKANRVVYSRYNGEMDQINMLFHDSHS